MLTHTTNGTFKLPSVYPNPNTHFIRHLVKMYEYEYEGSVWETSRVHVYNRVCKYQVPEHIFFVEAAAGKSRNMTFISQEKAIILEEMTNHHHFLSSKFKGQSCTNAKKTSLWNKITEKWVYF